MTIRVLNLEESKACIRELGFPLAFIDILEQRSVHPLIDSYWWYPWSLYSEPTFFEVYHPFLEGFEEILPLVEEGSVTALIACGFKGGRPAGFFRLIYEAPEECEFFTCYEALMTDLFGFLCQDRTDFAPIDSLAEKLEFKSIDRFIQLLSSIQNLEYEEQEQRIHTFGENLCTESGHH